MKFKIKPVFLEVIKINRSLFIFNDDKPSRKLFHLDITPIPPPRFSKHNRKCSKSKAPRLEFLTTLHRVLLSVYHALYKNFKRNRNEEKSTNRFWIIQKVVFFSCVILWWRKNNNDDVEIARRMDGIFSRDFMTVFGMGKEKKKISS